MGEAAGAGGRRRGCGFAKRRSSREQQQDRESPAAEPEHGRAADHLSVQEAAVSRQEPPSRSQRGRHNLLPLDRGDGRLVLALIHFSLSLSFGSFSQYAWWDTKLFSYVTEYIHFWRHTQKSTL
jgi:hypothetical protein